MGATAAATTKNDTPFSAYKTNLGAQLLSKNVDFENRIIKNAVIAQVGDLKDYRPWSINLEFLQDFKKDAERRYPKGLPGEFNHNYDSLGKKLGLWRNLEIKGKKLKGDFHIKASADKSPVFPNMGTYVLEAAAEDSTNVMTSIRFYEDYFYQKDGKGKELKVWYYDDDGNWVSSNPALGKIYPKLKEAKRGDIVGEGALTSTMFSPDALLTQLNDLSTQPGFAQMLKDNAGAFPVIAEVYAGKSLSSQLFKALNFFNSKSSKMSKDSKKSKKAEANKATKPTEEALASAPADKKALKAAKQLKKEKKARKKLEKELQAVNEKITSLSQTPAEKHTTGQEDTASGDNKEKPWMNLSVNKKAMKTYRALQKGKEEAT